MTLYKFKKIINKAIKRHPEATDKKLSDEYIAGDLQSKSVIELYIRTSCTCVGPKQLLLLWPCSPQSVCQILRSLTINPFLPGANFMRQKFRVKFHLDEFFRTSIESKFFSTSEEFMLNFIP